MGKEGATSYKQTKFGVLPRAKVLRLEVLGTKKGLIFLNQLVKDDKKITPDLIKHIHKISFSEILAHFLHRFVFIHPFVDYNGRTARMFTSYILKRLHLPIIEIKTDRARNEKYILERFKEQTEETIKI